MYRVATTPFYALICILIALSGCIFPASRSRSVALQKEGKTLVWVEEFDYIGLPDSAKWGYDLGDGCPKLCGWDNNELQYYTSNRSENARVENGHLIIEAHREKMHNKDFSSTRLISAPAHGD
jgi:hypothetical protein